MKTGKMFHSVLTILILLLIYGCSTAQENADEETAMDENKVIAKYEGGEITLKEFNEELEKVPPMSKRQFEGAKGRKDFLDRLVTNELMYKHAQELDLENDEEVIKQLEDLKMRVILRRYYDTEIQQKASLTEDEMREYYEENKDTFVDEKKIKVRQIVTETEEEAQAIKQQLADGADFEELAKTESIDEPTAKRGGVMGFLSEKNNYIPYVGKSNDFKEAAFALEKNVISDPIETSKGFHVIEVIEVQEHRQKPFDEVRTEIESTLQPELVRNRIESLTTDLKEKYDYVYYEENFIEKRDPKELFDEAQNSKDPRKALSLYEEIVTLYPESEHAPKAQFMVGFVYSEQLDDKDKAKIAFDTVMEKYPNSDLADDAKWMIENLDKNLDDFQDDEKSDTVKDAQKSKPATEETGQE